MTCPRCGTEGHFHRATVERNNGGAMLLLGGLLAYLLSRPSSEMYICNRCNYVFEPEPHINQWFALAILVLAVVTILAGLVYLLLGR